MKLRLLFWQALRVASCDRAGGVDRLSWRNLVLSAPWPKAGKLDGSKCRRIVLVIPRARYFVRCVVSATETHQSPIWLKADGERPALRPLAHEQPQKIVGTRPCPRVRVTDLWFPAVGRAKPWLVHGLGASVPFQRLHLEGVGWDSYQSHLVVVNQPYSLVRCPSHP